MPENAWGMSDDELLVANHIYKGFNKVPCKISVYAAEDNVRKVCFLSAPQPDGIVHIGTVGTFHRTMMGQPDGEEKFRVELVSSVRERFVDVMSDLLSFLCFCLDNQKFYYHCGAPLQDIFEHACYKKPRISVRHIVFCKPETFGLDLPGLTVQGETVKFLYVLPITDQELSFYRENGLPALVEQLKGGIDFRDLNASQRLLSTARRQIAINGPTHARLCRRERRKGVQKWDGRNFHWMN